MRSFLILLFLWPVVVNATDMITADALRLMAGQAERDERLRAARLDPNDLASLLPSSQTNNATAPEQTKVSEPPFSTKYTQRDGERDPAVKHLDVVKSDHQTIPQASLSHDLYIPPPRTTNTKDRIVADAVPVADQQQYGIRMGSWLRARLERNTTSADPGRVELVLTKDIEGEVRPLVRGTLLFAEKAYNPGTQRLDMQVVKAVTPDGDEITLRGLIYDENRNAGLIGIVTGNPVTESVQSGISRGLLDASRVAFTSLSDSAVVNAVTDATADAVIQDRQSILDARSSTPYTIHVAAQALFIRVEETF